MSGPLRAMTQEYVLSLERRCSDLESERDIARNYVDADVERLDKAEAQLVEARGLLERAVTWIARRHSAFIHDYEHLERICPDCQLHDKARAFLTPPPPPQAPEEIIEIEPQAEASAITPKPTKERPRG